VVSVYLQSPPGVVGPPFGDFKAIFKMDFGQHSFAIDIFEDSLLCAGQLVWMARNLTALQRAGQNPRSYNLQLPLRRNLECWASSPQTALYTDA
jgi:hypothetical protein